MNDIMIKDDDYCFACGKDNPIGLQMEVTRTEGKAEARLTLKKEHQGWKDIAHGGLVSTILDEMMAHAVVSKAPRAVTAEIKIRFKKVVPLNQPLIAFGEIKHFDRRRAVAVSELRIAETNELLATGESKFLIVNSKKL